MSKPMPIPSLALLLLPALLLAAAPSRAETDWGAMNRAVVEGHIVPRYRLLALATRDLAAHLDSFCGAPSPAGLAQARSAFAGALDAWEGIVHIRFGPVETEQRWYRFQLWPDKRGTGRRQVQELLAAADPARLAPEVFRQGSVGVQGFGALELLLFPEDQVTLADFGAAASQDGLADRDATTGHPADGESVAGAAGLPPPAFRCAFAQAIGANLRDMAAAVLADWSEGERPLRTRLIDPAPGAEADARLANPEVLAAELLKSLGTGAQVVHDQKLMPTLTGDIAQANPRRAESWRSRRSLANVCTNLRALEHLYASGFGPVLRALPGGDVADLDLALTLSSAVGACLRQPGDRLDLPPDPAHRAALEEVRDLTGALQARSGLRLGEALDLLIGFNSLDGD